IAELTVDDIVLVRAGARVPADGTIADGSAEFDEAMITGESQPVFRETGESVVAGTVATDNTVRIRVGKTGDDTALAGLQRRLPPVLVRPGRRCHHRHRLDPDRQPRPGGHPYRDRADHRLPTRPGPGDPAGHRDLH